ncbi:MFS transporter [Lactococcus lactis]|uniref:MFS transporter n=1 Tax=Lactococcus lactis TaxID=1358 RepID=UPI002025D6A2|nr:MFS transporter [Lactococcus lactis]MCL9638537.1 MFS transporter [Lactococcus lactis]
MVGNEKINFFREFFSFKTNKAEGIIGFHRALGIGSWDMFNGGTGGLIGSWLLYFMTSFGGVNPGLAALLISARLVIDMFWAPAVAVISDNFYHFALGRKYGRRRFFLIFAIPTSVAFAAMWIPMAGGLSWLYYLVSFILFDFCLDLVLIPWEAIPAEITSTYTQRNKMGSIRMWASGLAQPLIAFVPTLFMKLLPAEHGMQTSAWALFATACVWGVIGIIFTLFVYFSSWDPILISKEKTELMLRHLDEERKRAKTPARLFLENIANLLLTLRIKTFRKHLVLYFSTFGIIDSFTAIFVIFATISFLPTLTLDPAQAALILATPLLIMTMAYTPFGAWLFNHPKIGPRLLYLIGFGIGILACITYGIVYFTRGSLSEAQITGLIIFTTCVFTVGRNILGGLPWVVFPLIPDIDMIIHKEQRAGVFAGAMTFVRKFTNIVFNVVIGAVMGAAGYNQHVSNVADKMSNYVQVHHVTTRQAFHHLVTSSTLEHQIQSAGFGIAMLMTFLVGGLMLIALWNAFTFKLNSKTHAILVEEISRLQKADSIGGEVAVKNAKESADLKTKQTIEALSGLNYDKFVWTGK